MEAWSRREKPNLSWSHPWATAAATAIVRGFIGLTPLAPSFSSWQLKPQPGNATWGQLRVPTAAGFFDIAFNQTQRRCLERGLCVQGCCHWSGPGSFVATIHAPANTVGRVCLPKLGSSDYHVRVGTRTVLGKVDGDYVCADGLAPAKGESELRVERGG